MGILSVEKYDTQMHLSKEHLGMYIPCCVGFLKGGGHGKFFSEFIV